MEKIKKYLQYVGIVAAIIGIFAAIRYLALEFAAVRWTLLFLICGSIFQKVGIPGSSAISFIVQQPLHYMVTGFLFGYSNLNGFLAAHWIGLLITFAVLLSIYAYIDIYIFLHYDELTNDLRNREQNVKTPSEKPSILSK